MRAMPLAVALATAVGVIAYKRRRMLDAVVWGYVGRRVEPYVPARHSTVLTGLHVVGGQNGPAINLEADGSVRFAPGTRLSGA
jgi:hypothetical protein